MTTTARALAHPDMPDAAVLARIADRLKRDLGAIKVIVFGSVARGRATVHSDFDLLVIAPSEETAYVRMARARAAMRGLSTGLPVSPLVLTPEEVRRRRREAADPFILEVLEEGVEL
jgi:predicted nucleotidyltransferase